MPSGFVHATADARRAEALGARLPPLLVAAERVAATVAQGVHGRRRVGQGDSFWQFRRFVAGDPIARIDWRQSAKSGRPAPDGWFIRETEWEAAQTVCLWRDASASMRWRSRGAPVEKRDRAGSAAAGAGVAAAARRRAGDDDRARCATDLRPRRAGPAGRGAGRQMPTTMLGLPPRVPLPRHARVVLFGDFLSPLEEIQAAIGQLAAIPVSGYLLQVLDPAEADLPYSGRIRFRGLEREGDTLIPRVEGVRDEYAGA